MLYRKVLEYIQYGFGVKFITYISIANAPESTNLMAPPHVATEAAIKKTGISYSFLRNKFQPSRLPWQGHHGLHQKVMAW